MTEERKYDFSYTALSLGVMEMAYVANAQRSNEDIDREEFGMGKSTTGKRKLADINKRLKNITLAQRNLLIDGDLILKRQIAFLAVCKTHLFIRDFIVEVVREKYLLFDYQITDGDYLSFFRQKAELHEHVNNLTDKTKAKIRQVLFKILEQAGLIDDVNNRNIQPQFLDHELTKAIVDDDSALLKVFLLSDAEIQNLT
ncbi:MAG: DUF1819 family protein [Bacteroidales bacterium]|nr:DUF1819 family protein [Bacteroidales bacterium]MDD3011593.1 DUF1819 family protein [Bacteroidales bacterium]MDD3962079.1 DUF1819 family protein [Bacteroidales bacterium]MDY0285667.1 DUF1819 family protein [Bacteroidales bacterium]